MLLGLGLAACGSEAGPPDEPPAVLLEQAFSQPPDSGEVRIEASAENEGLGGLPVESAAASLSGPFVARGAELPAFDWELEAEAGGYGVDGALVSTGTDVFVVFFGENYRVGAPSVAELNQRLGASGAIAKLDPPSWFERPSYGDSEEVEGTDCVRVEGGLRASAAGRDLTRLAASLGLGPAARIAYGGSGLTDGSIDACIAPDDQSVRRLRVALPASKLELVFSDLGSEQTIEPPPGGGFQPIEELVDRIQTLSGFAF